MIIVYYTDVKNEEIRQCCVVPQGTDLRELEKQVERYNERQDRWTNANILKIKDSSHLAGIITFLVKNAKARVLFPKELIEDALQALDAAKEAIWSLEAAEEVKDESL